MTLLNRKVEDIPVTGKKTVQSPSNPGQNATEKAKLEQMKADVMELGGAELANTGIGSVHEQAQRKRFLRWQNREDVIGDDPNITARAIRRFKFLSGQVHQDEPKV